MSDPARGALTIMPLHGIPEVQAGDDLADLVDRGLVASGVALEDGDVLVVSSKIASKALGLVSHDPDRDRVVAAESVRVVAERRVDDRLTRIVVARSGPVMAAAGVDASNTGERGGLLLLPHDPDGVCERLHATLTSRHGIRLGVVLSDTAGRPWRVGQVDFALGAHGLAVVDDLRGGLDTDGRDLVVTTRALADEIASAADLVKGKLARVPAAVVRGLADAALADPELPHQGARDLVRRGPGDWFGHGRVEAVRAALGIEPGTSRAADVGIPSAEPETRTELVGRAVRAALDGDPEATADVGDESVTLGAVGPFELGRLVARLQAALWCERLMGVPAPPTADGCSVLLQVRPWDSTRPW